MFQVLNENGVVALDIESLIQAIQGYCVEGSNSLTPQAGSGALEVAVTSGTYYMGATELDFTGGSVSLDPGDGDPRKDLVTVDTNGALSVVKGVPAPPRPNDEIRFNTWQPSPVDASQVDGMVLAEVWVAADTDSIQNPDIRDRRFDRVELEAALTSLFLDSLEVTATATIEDLQAAGGDVDLSTADITTLDAEDGTIQDALIQMVDINDGDAALDTVAADSQALLPRYDSTSDAPQQEGSVIKVPSSGADPEGVYFYSPGQGQYVHLDEADGATAGDLSDLGINTTKDWGGYLIENLGKNGDVAPASYEALTVDDFDGGTLSDGYERDLASYDLQSTTAVEGQALKGVSEADGTKTTLVSESGLENYPQRGDAFEFRLYHDTSNSRFQFWFAKKDGADNPDAYQIISNASSGSFELLQRDESQDAFATLDETGVNIPDSEWLTIEVDWATDGEVTVTMYDAAGAEVGTLSEVDTSYSSGGIGFRVQDGSSNNAQETVYVDEITITRRHVREHISNSEKGVVELGGSEVQPRGAIHTGPGEVPPNRDGYPVYNLPVTDDLAQGNPVSYSLALSEDAVLSIEGEADGSGGVQNVRVGLNGEVLKDPSGTASADGMTADPEAGSEDGYIEVEVGGSIRQIPFYNP